MISVLSGAASLVARRKSPSGAGCGGRFSKKLVMPSMKSGRSIDSCISFSATALASNTSRMVSAYTCCLITAREFGAARGDVLCVADCPRQQFVRGYDFLHHVGARAEGTPAAGDYGAHVGVGLGSIEAGMEGGGQTAAPCVHALGPVQSQHGHAAVAQLIPNRVGRDTVRGAHQADLLGLSELRVCTL